MSSSIDQQLELPLKDVINDYVIPNCVLQIRDDIIDKSGVAIPFLLSKPGAGKTSIIYQICEAYGWGLLSVHLALKAIEELSGIPRFKKITIKEQEHLGTIWSISEIQIELQKLGAEHDLAILLLDDIHLAGPEYLALLQEMLTERSIKGYPLPSNVAIVLAGNQSSKSGFKSLSSAIINRCVKLPVYAKIDNWVSDFARPHEMHPAIISFVTHPQYMQYFHEDELLDEAWSSPRAWARLSNFLTAYEVETGAPLKNDQVLYYSTGHLGKQAASHFQRHYEIFMKFNIEEIFKNSDAFKVPNDPVDKYILIFACVGHIVKINKKGKSKIELVDKIRDIVIKYLDDNESLGLMFLTELVLINKQGSLIEKIVMAIEKIKPESLKAIMDKRDA